MEKVQIDEIGRDERLERDPLYFVKVCTPFDENYARAANVGSWQRRGESGFTIYAKTPGVLREIGELLLQGAARLATEPAGELLVQRVARLAAEPAGQEEIQ